MADAPAMGEKPSLAKRLQEELVKYGLVSGYLFICFSVLLLYEASVAGAGHGALTFSIAIVKALVLGKFLLIGDAMKAGSRANDHHLLARVAWKALAFLLVLLVFKALEELALGLFNGKSVAGIASELLERTWLENLAPILVMLFILIPLVSISEIYRQLGPQQFRALLFERSS